MNKGNVLYINNGILFTTKKNKIMSFAENRTRNHPVKWNKPDSERQISRFLSYEESRFKKITGHENRRGIIWEEEGGNKGWTWSRHTICIYVKNVLRKPIKYIKTNKQTKNIRLPFKILSLWKKCICDMSVDHKYIKANTLE
jgi:hypothetical protein